MHKFCFSIVVVLGSRMGITLLVGDEDSLVVSRASDYDYVCIPVAENYSI